MALLIGAPRSLPLIFSCPVDTASHAEYWGRRAFRSSCATDRFNLPITLNMLLLFTPPKYVPPIYAVFYGERLILEVAGVCGLGGGMDYMVVS